MTTIDQDKSCVLKKILKVDKEDLIIHKGDKENPRPKSTNTLGALNSNQEFVIAVIMIH
jgi:hypothetical protein